MKGIYPGSFDPVTNGHFDIIKRAALLCKELTVLVCVNPQKKGVFSSCERLEFLNRITKNIENVKCDVYEGLLIDYFKKSDANVIIKGLRAMSDFEIEFQMAQVNKDLCPWAETIFLCSAAKDTFLSSSVVRQLSMFGADISAYVPQTILSDIEKRFKNVKNIKK